VSYEIPVPYRDREQPLVDVRSELRDAPLDETETDLARAVIDEALFREGDRTAGDLLDRLDHADGDQRRQILDRARAAIGLDSVAEVERRRDLAHARRNDIPPPPSRRAAGPPRDKEGRAWQSCSAPSCEVTPTGDDGMPAPSRAVRWWCEGHRDQAADGDLADWQPPALVFGRAGLEQPLTDEDRAYYRELDEQREQDQRERNRRRAEDAERLERLEREHRANLPRTPGF